MPSFAHLWSVFCLLIQGALPGIVIAGLMIAFLFSISLGKDDSGDDQ